MRPQLPERHQMALVRGQIRGQAARGCRFVDAGKSAIKLVLAEARVIRLVGCDARYGRPFVGSRGVVSREVRWFRG